MLPSEVWSGRRESNPRPTAWKAVTLPTELRPHLPQTCNYTQILPTVNRFYGVFLRPSILLPTPGNDLPGVRRASLASSVSTPAAREHASSNTLPGEGWWRGEDSNLRRRRQQIYSLPPLAARVPLHLFRVALLRASRQPANRRFGATEVKLRSRLPLLVAGGVVWSRREELNLQPSDYKSDALPLSYVGAHLFRRLANILGNRAPPHPLRLRGTRPISGNGKYDPIRSEMSTIF